MNVVFLILFLVVSSWAQELWNYKRGCPVQTLTFTRGTPPFSFRLVGPIGDRPIYQEETGVGTPYLWTLPPFPETTVDVYIIAFDSIGRRGESRAFNITAEVCAITSMTLSVTFPIAPTTYETPSSTPRTTTSTSTPTLPPSQSSPEQSTSSPTSSSVGPISPQEPDTSSSNGDGTPPPNNSPNTALIAGAAAGGSAALIVVVVAFWFYFSRKRPSKLTGQRDDSVPAMGGSGAPIIAPYTHNNSTYYSGAPISAPYAKNERFSSPIGPTPSAYNSTNPTSSPVAGSSPYFAPNTIQPFAASSQSHPSRQSVIDRSTSPTATEEFPPMYAASTTEANSQRARTKKNEQDCTTH
ncbi:hypothetical protein M408DRAFT_169722 [Serendipita vermifera MAFF 305830]|uniref:Mid2 domain-containing protein n=1 Tax=Serendipita vermifera MAFF 305830 TaxID=933852 RepID=A0A0C2WMA3_SERVB|nr:hypothetical protein M408DRAFT_169722 [Serendipita vermifera MAFF 305830]